MQGSMADSTALLERLWLHSGAELASAPRPVADVPAAPGTSPLPSRASGKAVHMPYLLDVIRTPALSPSSAHSAVAALTAPAHDAAPRVGSAHLLTAPVFGALMNAYARQSRWRDAVALIGRARAAGLSPTQRLYTIAMHAAAMAGEHHVARVLLDAAPGTPTRVAWETLALAQAHRGLPEEVERTLAEAQRQGLAPRDYAAVALITAYSLAGRPRIALRVSTRLKTLGVQPTVHVLNALLSVCVRHGLYERGLRVLQTFDVRGSTVRRTPATEQLVRVLCQKEVSNIERQQAVATALSAAAAAVGGALMRSGVF
jgi:pentatricopeptide repeat protein